jgi:uncharacterized membrane-anchored protein
MNRQANIFTFLLAFCITCIVTGSATFLGSVAGHSIGKNALLVLAIVGGIAGIYISCKIIIRLRGFKPSAFRNMFIGGIIGYLAAAIIAVIFLHYPFIVIASIILPASGVMAGHNIGNKTG